MTSLYLECSSGISGDMTVAALLDLGADREVLERALKSLPLDGYRTEIRRVSKSGIDACDFRVILDREHENHDHDMDYLYGHTQEHCHDQEHDHHEHEHEHGHGHEHRHDHEHEHHHEHHHEHEHDHSHEHHHDHHHDHDHPHEHHHDHHHDHDHPHDHPHDHGHSHSHQHRGMQEIREIIGNSTISPRARELSLRIFTILAEAEAKAHGVPADEVHFHEVGAVDSIVDIVAAAVCLDDLGIEHVILPSLCEGQGTVRCQHGILPVPVPAVANIARAHHLPLRFVKDHGEFVTPTGAAIAAAIRTESRLPDTFSIVKIGIGAGKREYERPGILRAMLIEAEEEACTAGTAEDEIVKLETNIDDCSGEVLGYVMEQLFAAGARDVHYIPVYGKKNRPSYLLNVICREENREKLEEILFRETTTIGIRRCVMKRSVLEREIREVTTPYGTAQIKLCRHGDSLYRYPEYDSAAKIARETGLPLETVYEAIRNAQD